jgi:hypothetical protein
MSRDICDGISYANSKSWDKRVTLSVSTCGIEDATL